MKLGFALLAGLLISTSANAEVMATWSREQANSDRIVVSITDELSSHPYCKGKKEVRATMEFGGMDRPFARGCWTMGADQKYLSIDMYAYSDGRSMSFPIKTDELKLSQRVKDALKPHMDKARKSSQNDAEELYGAATSTRDDISMYYAGVCEAMRLAEANAQTPEQKKMADAIRDAIIKTTDTEARLVDDYCDAKSRMFHTAQR